ncbi:hypothetical protein EDB85DRAFT_1901280 [Lactarius pseudohatsudake]|nr:hypothetical protein EDB85DRAFT_1901280 [Lactarius pseudohatsudake]
MNRKKTGTGPDCNRWQPDRRLRFIRSEDFTGCVDEPPQGRLGPVSTGLYTNTTPTRKTQDLHQRHRQHHRHPTTTTSLQHPGWRLGSRTDINDDNRADTNSGPATTTINHDHLKSSTTPTATTPTPTTPTTRQWPRQDLRRPRRLRRHDHHREPATWTGINENNPANTNDYDRRLQSSTTTIQQPQRLGRHDDNRTTTGATFGHNNDTLNNDDATTTATATATCRQLQKQHVDNRDDDRDDDEKGEDSGSARTMAMATQTDAHAAVDSVFGRLQPTLDEPV